MVKVAFGMPCYGSPKHETIDSIVKMVAEFNSNGKFEFEWISAWDALICPARESIADEAIKRGCKYLLFLDADMVFLPSMAERLVWAAETYKWPILSGYYCQRKDPHHPLIYNKNGANYSPYTPNAYREVIDCDATGLGACLIHLDVFRGLERPWFAMASTGGNLPQSEDLYFFEKARSAGYRVKVHTGLPCGHMADGKMIRPPKEGDND